MSGLKLSHGLFVTFVAMLLSGCHPGGTDAFPGYAEGEYVRMASPVAGNLAILNVKRGDYVPLNAPLFALEQENERAARAEAQARMKAAEAQAENLKKGRRPEEISAIRAQLAQAEAAQKLSVTELRRTEELVVSKFLSPAKLDEARAAVERDRSRVAELNAQIRIAQLVGRIDEQVAAEAIVKASQEQLAQADWRLAQKSQRAPKAALVADTLYTAGEWVPAGLPVVSLLPPENIKLKFFISEKILGAIKIGQMVQVSCDGCGAPISATISYISPQAEYTSPLIYSKENRTNLVFMIEARPKPEEAMKLHPGQPVEIRLSAAAGV